nr:RiPP maturation radical SAM C-methyltransferase [Streptomyces sp. CBMA152]
MPWAALDTPSLGLGILHGIAREHGAEVETLCANLDYYDWAARESGLTAEDYDFFATRAYFDGYGDWVFSSALYGDPAWRMTEFRKDMASGLDERLRETSIRLHESAPRFIDELATRIVETGCELVGFTTTFQQSTAALAAARQIKRLAPQTVVVLGGANCDGPQGAALHRNFPYLDYVVRGEAERAFPALLDVLRGHGDAAAVPGLCWTAEDGTRVANDMSAAPLPPRHWRSPDYDAYFTRVEHSSARCHIEPKLVLEGSRGCWWGEKHHCTFCGLNGSSMAFRSKEPVDFLHEITSLARRHHVLDVVVVDNILDMGFVRHLLPALIDTGSDFRFHYEIKSNLRYRELRTLADAGLVHVQPGIESLSTRVLQQMNKGVTGCQNVRHLRDAQSAGLWTVWNYLYGFPEESDDNYTSVMGQLPALHHLAPPEGVTRIAIERFSPYFDRPELGFTDLKPAPHYARIYDLPEQELYDLAYVFDAPPAGIDSALAEQLEQSVARWRELHRTSMLTHHDLGHKIVLVSRRHGFDWSTLTLDEPIEVAAFRLLEEPRSVHTLTRRLTARFGSPVPESRVSQLLADWRALGILFEDADRFVHVAPLATNAELTRIGEAAPDMTRNFLIATEAADEQIPVAAR